MHVSLRTWTAAFVAALAIAGALRAGANWQLQPYNLVIPASIAGVGQSTSGSLSLTLAHDTPCTISVSVAQAGNELLRNGSSSLTTSYKLTGAAVQNADGAWVDSAAFVGHVYSVLGVGPVDQITLAAQGAAAPASAPDAGTYSANLILTVSW